MTSDPAAAAVPRAAGRGGLIATIVLCVALVAYTVLLSIDGLFIGFVSDSCSGNSCNFELLQIAIIVGAFGPAVVSVVAIVVSIVRLVRRRRLAWLFPIGAGLLGTVILLAAAALGYASAGLVFTL